MTRINLDTNATTPVLPVVREAMEPFWAAGGNPSSAHTPGRTARRALEEAREKLAKAINAHPTEITFTSGATEANNIAIMGLAGEVITSEIEHPCVVEPIRTLEKKGIKTTWLGTNEAGVVELSAILAAIQPTTKLVALMAVNHETGAVQPVDKLRATLHETVHIHCDAAQALGKIPVDVKAWGVTTLAATAHKLGGPVGIGLLFKRKDAVLRPLVYGGHQEAGLRPGTVPVALAVGFATAVEHAVLQMDKNHQQLKILRTAFWNKLQTDCGPVISNSSESSYPGTLNVSFVGCRADVLLMALDLQGISCSTGSACSSGSLVPSPVLKAMKGMTDERLRSAIRFSFAASYTVEEIVTAAEVVAKAINQMKRV